MAFTPGVQKKSSTRKQDVTISKKGSITRETITLPSGQQVDIRGGRGRVARTEEAIRQDVLPERAGSTDSPLTEDSEPVRSTSTEEQLSQSLPSDLRNRPARDVQDRVSRPVRTFDPKAAEQAGAQIEAEQQARREGGIVTTTVVQPQRPTLQNIGGSEFLVSQTPTRTFKVEPVSDEATSAARSVERQRAVQDRLRGVKRTEGLQSRVGEGGASIISLQETQVETRPEGVKRKVGAILGEPPALLFGLTIGAVKAQEKARAGIIKRFEEKTEKRGRARASAELGGELFVAGAALGLGASFVKPGLAIASKATGGKTVAGKLVRRVGIPLAFSTPQILSIVSSETTPTNKLRAGSGIGFNLALFNIDKALAPVRSLAAERKLERGVRIAAQKSAGRVQQAFGKQGNLVGEQASSAFADTLQIGDQKFLISGLARAKATRTGTVGDEAVFKVQTEQAGAARKILGVEAQLKRRQGEELLGFQAGAGRGISVAKDNRVRSLIVEEKAVTNLNRVARGTTVSRIASQTEKGITTDVTAQLTGLPKQGILRMGKGFGRQENISTVTTGRGQIITKKTDRVGLAAETSPTRLLESKRGQQSLGTLQRRDKIAPTVGTDALASSAVVQLLKPAVKVASKTRLALFTEQAITSRHARVTAQTVAPLRTGQRLTQNLVTATRQKTIQDPITKQIIGQRTAPIIKQLVAQVPRPTNTPLNVPLPTTPPTPPRQPPPPFFFGFGGGGSAPRGSRRGKTGIASFKYRPSLVALDLGLTAKKKPKRSQKATGLGIRLV